MPNAVEKKRNMLNQNPPLAERKLRNQQHTHTQWEGCFARKFAKIITIIYESTKSHSVFGIYSIFHEIWTKRIHSRTSERKKRRKKFGKNAVHFVYRAVIIIRECEHRALSISFRIVSNIMCACVCVCARSDLKWFRVSHVASQYVRARLLRLTVHLTERIDIAGSEGKKSNKIRHECVYTGVKCPWMISIQGIQRLSSAWQSTEGNEMPKSSTALNNFFISERYLNYLWVFWDIYNAKMLLWIRFLLLSSFAGRFHWSLSNINYFASFDIQYIVHTVRIASIFLSTIKCRSNRLGQAGWAINGHGCR